jgi:hypothetical protein
MGTWSAAIDANNNRKCISVLAPAKPVFAASPDSQYVTTEGTSFSSPYVVAVIHAQLNKYLSVFDSYRLAAKGRYLSFSSKLIARLPKRERKQHFPDTLRH